MSTAFDISRRIFRKEFQKIQEQYGTKEIHTELELVIGAITESKELIKHALNQEGGTLNMCNALEELKQEGKMEGIAQGIEQGIAQGIEQGIAQKTYIMVKNLLRQGLFPEEVIAEAAEISMEELWQIKEQIK